MEEMLGTLIKMVGENNSRLKTLEDKTDRLESKTDRLESKVDKLESDMQEVKSSVKELMQGQERQDRILEMLSVKSIETDSYIQEFKRKM
jgi:chaperonin cofactor prefoldin